MAEVAQAEPEVTPSEEAAVATPESAPEAVPAPENTDTSIDEIVSSISSAFTDNGAKDGSNAASDAVVPPAGPTPEQIAASVRTQVESENRLKGLKWVAMEDGPAKLLALDDGSLSDQQRAILHNEINRIKGAFEPLLQRAVDVDTTYAPQVRQAALKEAEDWTLGQLTSSIKKTLGDAEAKAFSEAKHGSWEDVGAYFTKAARKGYVPVEQVTTTLRERFAVYDQALKERAEADPPIITRSLSELKGSTGPETPTATGGTGGRMTVAKYEAMSIDEQAKVPAAERARIYGAIR